MVGINHVGPRSVNAWNIIHNFPRLHPDPAQLSRPQSTFGKTLVNCNTEKRNSVLTEFLSDLISTNLFASDEGLGG